MPALFEIMTARREHLGLTMDDVAEACGVSKPSVWAWEKGKAYPKDHHRTALCIVMGWDALPPRQADDNLKAIVSDIQSALSRLHDWLDRQDRG